MFCCTRTVGFQKFVQYIRMLCPGRFILVESVFDPMINIPFSMTDKNGLERCQNEHSFVLYNLSIFAGY